jgi:hypothetical protein
MSFLSPEDRQTLWQYCQQFHENPYQWLAFVNAREDKQCSLEELNGYLSTLYPKDPTWCYLLTLATQGGTTNHTFLEALRKERLTIELQHPARQSCPARTKFSRKQWNRLTTPVYKRLPPRTVAQSRPRRVPVDPVEFWKPLIKKLEQEEEDQAKKAQVTKPSLSTQLTSTKLSERPAAPRLAWHDTAEQSGPIQAPAASHYGDNLFARSQPQNK